MTRRPLILLSIALAFALIAGGCAAPDLDEVVFGGEFVVGEGDVVEGDLLVFGGSVDVQSGGRIEGAVTAVGGTVTIDGEIGGGIRQFGGTLELEDGAAVAGDLVSTGGILIRSESAVIDGEVRTMAGDGPDRVTGDRRRHFGDLILAGYWNLFSLIATAGLALVIGVLWPRQLSAIGRSIAENPVMAGGVGLLTVGVVVPALVVAALTLILIPVSLAGFVLLGAAGAVGWIALSCEIGRRIGDAAGQAWAPGPAAGGGALLLGIVFAGIDQVPCVGWAMQAAIGLVGLGAVVLTRFGTQPGAAE